MTPLNSKSSLQAFTSAAKRDDHEEMRRLITQVAEGPTMTNGKSALFLAFDEALADNRMGTVAFLMQETALPRAFSMEILEERAQAHGRTLRMERKG